jgi:hypothetical protein
VPVIKNLEVNHNEHGNAHKSRKWHQNLLTIVIGVVIIVAGAGLTYLFGFTGGSNAEPQNATTSCTSWSLCNPGPGTTYRVNSPSYLLCPTPYEYSNLVCSSNQTAASVDVICTFVGKHIVNSTRTIDDDNWDFVAQGDGSWIPDEFVDTVGNNKSPPKGVPTCVKPK